MCLLGFLSSSLSNITIFTVVFPLHIFEMCNCCTQKSVQFWFWWIFSVSFSSKMIQQPLSIILCRCTLWLLFIHFFHQINKQDALEEPSLSLINNQPIIILYYQRERLATRANIHFGEKSPDDDP